MKFLLFGSLKTDEPNYYKDSYVGCWYFIKQDHVFLHNKHIYFVRNPVKVFIHLYVLSYTKKYRNMKETTGIRKKYM